jgi:hypothetical protein
MGPSFYNAADRAFILKTFVQLDGTPDHIAVIM